MCILYEKINMMVTKGKNSNTDKTAKYHKTYVGRRYMNFMNFFHSSLDYLQLTATCM